MCCILYLTPTKLYGWAVYSETQEWNYNAITDVITINSNDVCPKSYELLYADFYGTYDLCLKKDNYYSIGACANDDYGKNSGQFIEGIPLISMPNFEGKSLCY